jgi:hypothetical protein
MNMQADALLEGAIDLHCHGYPEISPDLPCGSHSNGGTRDGEDELAVCEMPATCQSTCG